MICQIRNACNPAQRSDVREKQRGNVSIQSSK